MSRRAIASRGPRLLPLCRRSAIIHRRSAAPSLRSSGADPTRHRRHLNSVVLSAFCLFDFLLDSAGCCRSSHSGAPNGRQSLNNILGGRAGGRGSHPDPSEAPSRRRPCFMLYAIAWRNNCLQEFTLVQHNNRFEQASSKVVQLDYERARSRHPACTACNRARGGVWIRTAASVE